jgi:hemerythrin
MTLIPQKAVPSVLVDFMNYDHAEAADLINDVDALLTEGAEPERIETALVALFEHTREHFAREESEMRAVGFPAYPLHKVEHDRILTELDEELATFGRTHDVGDIASYVRGVLPGWLLDHISTMDTVTAQFIAQAAPRK